MTPYIIAAHAPHPGADADGPGPLPPESVLSDEICRRVVELYPSAILAQGATSGERRAFVAAQRGPRLGIEVHADIGEGSRGAVFFWPGSRRGARSAFALAQALTESIRLLIPGYRCHAQGIDAGYPRVGQALRWTWPVDPDEFERVRDCAGVLIETGFLDQDDHRPLWTPEGYGAIALGIARGLGAM